MTVVLVLLALVLVGVALRRGHLRPLVRYVGYGQLGPDEAGFLRPRWTRGDDRDTKLLDQDSSPFFTRWTIR